MNTLSPTANGAVVKLVIGVSKVRKAVPTPVDWTLVIPTPFELFIV